MDDYLEFCASRVNRRGSHTPDVAAHTLNIRLYHLTRAAHERAVEQLLADLNATQAVFPGTALTLFYKLGSS